MLPERYTVPQVQDRIEGAAALTEFYGYFPSFHDAEVVSLALNRAGPSLVLSLHSFRPTTAVDDMGYYVMDRHALVDIRFVQVTNIALNGFNHQNVVARLVFVDAPEGRIACHLDESHGLQAQVTAGEVAITFRPANADGTPIPPHDR